MTFTTEFVIFFINTVVGELKMAQDITELKNAEVRPKFDQLPPDEKIKILTQLARVSKEFVGSVKAANLRKQNADK